MLQQEYKYVPILASDCYREVYTVTKLSVGISTSEMIPERGYVINVYPDGILEKN